jgi:predicted transcriptional regulator
MILEVKSCELLNRIGKNRNQGYNKITRDLYSMVAAHRVIKEMERKGLITLELDGAKRIPHLTEKGKMIEKNVMAIRCVL